MRVIDSKCAEGQKQGRQASYSWLEYLVGFQWLTRWCKVWLGSFQEYLSYQYLSYQYPALQCYLSWTKFQSCVKPVTCFLQNWVENYCQLLLRIALMAFMVDGPYYVCSGFHGYFIHSPWYSTPPKHLSPYSLSTDEKAEVIIHSTFIQQCTEEKYFAFLPPFQLKENISSPFLLLSIISSESQPSHMFRDQ